MYRHKIGALALIGLASLLAWLTLSFGGGSDYDLQALSLLFLRVTVWFILVVGYVHIKSILEEDDLAEDWKRINDGNSAVGIYRGMELLGVCIAIGLLVSKV